VLRSQWTTRRLGLVTGRSRATRMESTLRTGG
jgi:hypothetical protein